MFYPGGGGEAVEVRVLAEATIDLSTGEASPSQTYQEEGLSYAGDYRQSFRSLRWTLPFDDRDMVQLGQADWSSVTAIPGLFQNGKTLWSLVYDKENGQMKVRFATAGPAPEGVWNVTVTGEDGAVAAQGTLSPRWGQRCAGPETAPIMSGASPWRPRKSSSCWRRSRLPCPARSPGKPHINERCAFSEREW